MTAVDAQRCRQIDCANWPSEWSSQAQSLLRMPLCPFPLLSRLIGIARGLLWGAHHPKRLGGGPEAAAQQLLGCRSRFAIARHPDRLRCPSMCGEEVASAQNVGADATARCGARA